ncbi:MAG TPA: ABC-type transport auxiliary lipoprotein family protein [Candidatus Nitrosotalea sp.]|nr:ABC-type transport auxiliary lipoprotein family protein [Candidatus Nitrosotalea sp.]
MKDSKYFDRIATSGHPSRWIAGISCVVLFASAFAFSGCLSRSALKKQTFAFSTPMSPTTNRAASDRVLGIRTLQIAPLFDGRSLVYRTGEFSYARDPYAQFLDPPAEGLLVPVCELLRGDGCFSAVVEAGSAVKPDTMAEINITQLYGDIRKPESPCAVLALQVTFLDATNGLPGSVVLQRDYSRRIPMKSATSAALMEGWNEALFGIFAEAAADFRNREIEGHLTQQ